MNTSEPALSWHVSLTLLKLDVPFIGKISRRFGLAETILFAVPELFGDWSTTVHEFLE